MDILGYHKLSLLDYPAKPCSVVFTGDCNFRCPYCHNKNMVNRQGDSIDEESLERALLNRKKYVQNLCISGGEPTLQRDLVAFIKKYKGHGFNIKLDTNGTNPEVLKELLEKKLLDYVAMDLKTDIHHYQQITGTGNFEGEVMRSIELLKNSPVNYEFRTTFVKGLMTPESIEGLKQMVDGCQRYVLQRGRLDNNVLLPDEKMTSYTNDEMEGLKEEFRPFVKTIQLNP